MRNREKLCRISIRIFLLSSELNYSAAKRSFLKQHWSAPLWHSEISSHFKSCLPLLTRVLWPLSSRISHLSTSSSSPTPRLTHRVLTLVLSTYVFAARFVLFFSFFLFHYYVSLKFSLESRSRKSCESTSSWAHSCIFFLKSSGNLHSLHTISYHLLILPPSSVLWAFESICKFFMRKEKEKKRKLVHEKRRRVGKSSFTVYFAWAYKHHHHRTLENDFSTVKRKKGFRELHANTHHTRSSPEKK